jgi:hypothetical protein
LFASFVVATGEVVWDLRHRRTNLDFREHFLQVAAKFPQIKQFDWVVDNLNTPMSLTLCEAVAYSSNLRFYPKSLKTQIQRRAWLSDPEHQHVFHYLPRHGSWLNQAELFFSVLVRQFLRRGDFSSVAEFTTRLKTYRDYYNQTAAHPYRWTDTGEPWVRQTPLSQTPRQRRAGRAGFGTRPQLYQRWFQPPRPYQRRTKPNAAPLATNL